MNTNKQAFLASTLEQLAAIKAEIADLRKQEEELKDALIDSGEKIIDSHDWHCVISTTTRTVIDWKTVAAKAGASRQLIRSYTSEGEPTTSVRLYARKAS